MMPMDGQEKEATFKCPACGEEMKVESKGEDMSEDKPSKKSNAGNMPMGQLKSKISQPTTNPPGTQSPNLNSY